MLAYRILSIGGPEVLRSEPVEVELVFDLVDGGNQYCSWAFVAAGGALISTLTESSSTEAAARGARAARYSARPDGAQLSDIPSLISAGAVRVIVAEAYPFDAAADTLERLDKGRVQGKVVTEVSRTT